MRTRRPTVALASRTQRLFLQSKDVRAAGLLVAVVLESSPPGSSARLYGQRGRRADQVFLSHACPTDPPQQGCEAWVRSPCTACAHPLARPPATVRARERRVVLGFRSPLRSSPAYEQAVHRCALELTCGGCRGVRMRVEDDCGFRTDANYTATHLKARRRKDTVRRERRGLACSCPHRARAAPQQGCVRRCA